MKELGRYEGVVVHGHHRGAELGYPTVNIPLTDSTASGVYIARVTEGKRSWASAAFADPKRGVLEAHILDFSESLYGKRIGIELLKKLRDRERFLDDRTLRDAIAHDIESVRAHFRQ